MLRLKEWIVRIAGKCGVKLINMKHYLGPKPDMDPAFVALYERCRPYTLIRVERMYSLYKAVQYIVKKGIPGDFVECGVWKGGASMMMALTLKELGVTNRKIYMYDTYEGMAKPTVEDRSVVSGKGSVMSIWEKAKEGDHNAWCYGPLDGVRSLLLSSGYPEENLIFVKGMVEDTIPGTLPKSIALLRLDTDFYSSTKHEMEHLYPLLEREGVLILDDYNYWAGARQAVDEYMEKHKITLLLHRDDDSGCIGIRT